MLFVHLWQDTAKTDAKDTELLRSFGIEPLPSRTVYYIAQELEARTRRGIRDPLKYEWAH